MAAGTGGHPARKPRSPPDGLPPRWPARSSRRRTGLAPRTCRPSGGTRRRRRRRQIQLAAGHLGEQVQSDRADQRLGERVVDHRVGASAGRCPSGRHHGGGGADAAGQIPCVAVSSCHVRQGRPRLQLSPLRLLYDCCGIGNNRGNRGKQDRLRDVEPARASERHRRFADQRHG